MSINSISSFTNKFRLSGLSGSGLDTDQLVSDLMKAERAPLDKLYQKRQLAVWKQEAYRDITNKLRALKDDYFNVVKPSNNMLSTSVYKKFTASSSDSTVVTAVGTANAINGSYKITVNQIASGEVRISKNSLDETISTSETINTIMGKLGGVIQPVDVTGDGNSDGQGISFDINGIDFNFLSSDTLSTVITKVNSSTANVTMQYDEITNRIKMTSKQTGVSGTVSGAIAATDSKGIDGVAFTDFLTKVNLADGQDQNADPDLITMTKTAAKDALVRFDGSAVDYESSKNTFTVNGITYTLKAPGVEQTITIAQDTDAIFKNIGDFVSKYNETIKSLNDKTVEKYDRDYPPLTDAQKENMEAEDIAKWEAKAKTGLLRNDSLLNNITSAMRRALYDSVEGSPISLNSIGITTSSYQDKGKLVVDENKLKEAIANNPDAIMQLFSKQSANVTTNINLTSSQRATRYNENGLAYRISDILDDNIRTYGGKGLLLEKAGMTGDITEVKNTIFEEIKRHNVNIDNLIDKLTTKETNYYNKFARLEKLLADMNNQGNYFASQMNSK